MEVLNEGVAERGQNGRREMPRGRWEDEAWNSVWWIYEGEGKGKLLWMYTLSFLSPLLQAIERTEGGRHLDQYGYPLLLMSCLFIPTKFIKLMPPSYLAVSWKLERVYTCKIHHPTVNTQVYIIRNTGVYIPAQIRVSKYE